MQLDDLTGDLHAHTMATDGHNTIEEMARVAQQLGFTYIAITEHSKRLTVTHGLDEKRFLQQIEEIDCLNQRLKGITVLKGIEVDILEDGSLDLLDTHCRMAKESGVLVSINSDAHTIADLVNLKYGIGQARRG